MLYEGETQDPVYRGDTYNRGVQPALSHVTTAEYLGPLTIDLTGANSTEGLIRRVEDSAREEGWRRALN